MSVQPIRPVGDERIQHKTAVLNGHTYHYLYAVPNSGKWTDTVFLDAPKVPPNPINLYGLKRASDDIAALAKEVDAPSIILGGHDWGGFVLHLASGEVEKSVKDEESIRQFLKGLYGARGPNGELVFDPEKGVIAENLPKIGESKILYGEISAHLTRLVNWYRQRRTNWEEDQGLLDKKTIQQPVLFIQATYDSVLKPEMSKSMDALIPNLTRGEVAATHWALTQKPEDVNGLISQWLEKEGLIKSKSVL
ncbi:hypothetical protein N0V95_005773 [Ascochyta clinopodiicola]|nr:hypothetical protein N0V95_005773 [Ascochyta clinopodiicola]